MGSRWKVLIGMWVGLLWPLTANGGQYTFTKIAETGGQFALLQDSMINDQGVVAFKGYSAVVGSDPAASSVPFMYSSIAASERDFATHTLIESASIRA